MTTLTIPAPVGHDDYRPVPWRRMAWVIWRQHRLTLAAVVLVLGGAGVFHLITGHELVGVQVNGSSESVVKGATVGQMGPTQYLLHHGFMQSMSYQPASRFWPFQWIEGGWLLALSLLLMATAVWLVHRRAV